MNLLLKPHVVTDAMLVSSTVPEPSPGEVAWSSTTAYAKDAVVYLASTHTRYQAAAANTNRNPATDTVTPEVWVPIGPTNRHAMFDDAIGTRTVGTSPMTVVLRPGSTGGVGFLELDALALQLTMKDSPGGTVISDRTIDLDGTVIESIYDWFFAEFEPMTDLVQIDLPAAFPSCELTLTLTSTSGQVSVGAYKPGAVTPIGETQYGATVGIIDFSGKERDKYGRITVVEREFSKRATFSIMTQQADFNRIFRLLASVRAKPCFFIGTELYGYEPLLVYGFYRDFSIDVAYPTHHLCSLEVEGMTQN